MSTGYTPPFFLEQFTDQSGKPLSGGSLTFLVAGSTSLPKNIFLDFALQNVADNPWPLDSVGRAGQYYMESGAYKIIIKDSTGAIIATRDYIEGTVSSGTAVDEYKVKTMSIDTSPDFLNNKLFTSSTVAIDIQDIGGHNEVMSFRVIESGLNGYPKGPAGGDLAGTYPDPIVKQLTGLSAAMVAKTPGFSYPTSPAMTGIGAGYIYINSLPVKAWGAISFAGHIRWSTDNWISAIEDDGLFAHGTSFGANWNAFSFIKSGADYYWVAGDGYNQAFFMAKHIPANYNIDGTIKTAAWIKVQYPSTDYAANRLMPGNVGDIAYANGITCWVGNSTYIGRTTDYVNFTSPAIGAYMNTGGIATDGYDTWISVIKASGDIWISSGNQAVTWIQQTNLVVDGVSMTHLPVGNNEQWGSILCSYGVWVAAVYAGNTGHISYAYSTDTLNWTTVSNADITFFSAASNGVSWYATNPVANSTNPIYQLLIAEIPAHKKLIAEKGMAIAGDLNLVDLPNAAYLITDQYGKVIAGDPNLLGGKVLVDSADTTQGYLRDKLATTLGLVSQVIGSGNETLSLKTSGHTPVDITDPVYDYLDQKIIGDGQTVDITLDQSATSHKLVISARTSGSVGTSGQSATMPIASANQTIAPNYTGSYSELTTRFSPYVDQNINNATTVFRTYLIQGATGTLRFTLRDSSGYLIAYSGLLTNPTSNSFLSSMISILQTPGASPVAAANYKLQCNSYYTLGILFNSNSFQFPGTSISSNWNISPWVGAKYDNLVSTPVNQLTSGMGSESMMRIFEEII